MLGRVLALGAVALSLGACASEVRTAAATQAAGFSPAEIEAASRAACRAYGIAPSSDRYERCVRNEYASRSSG